MLGLPNGIGLLNGIGLPNGIAPCLFDLDGVLTQKARVRT
jgi:hypothetical protein